MQSHISSIPINDPQSGAVTNESPIIIKYTDALIGVDKWPSIVSNWQVVTDDGHPTLNLLFNFDKRAYDGLLKIGVAEGTNSQVTAIFTVELDPASATDKLNYIFNDDIIISDISLKEDKKSVEIRVDKLPVGGPLELQVKDILNADKIRSFAGSASCSAEPDVVATSTLMTKAIDDQSLYEIILAQLSDDAGVELFINTSLVPGSDLVLSADQTGELVQNWLGSIYRFTKDRSEGNDAVGSPTAQHILSFIFKADKVEIKNIFQLQLGFIIKRVRSYMGDSNAKDILVSNTAIAPLPDPSDHLNRYSKFVKDFEDTLSPYFELRVAAGVDSLESEVSADSRLWAVRLYRDELSAKPSIGYHVNVQEEPKLFAPKPISNQLISRRNVATYSFNLKTGIDYGNPVYKDFSDVDINSWCRQLFENFDELLTSQYTDPIKIVDSRNKILDSAAVSYIKMLMAQKELLADILKNLIIPVFESQSTIEKDIQENFRQALLARLSNVFYVRSGLQFSANVFDNNLSRPAKLYGIVIQNNGTKGRKPVQNIQFTASRLSLETNEKAALNFLLIAPQVVTGHHGQALSHISLDLSCAATSIEYQASELPDVKDRKASQWLKFFSKECSVLSSRALCDGSIEVPLPLNVFPALPVMTGHSGQLSEQGNKNILSDLLKWDYRFSYSQAIHYPQDVMHFAIQFNPGSKRVVCTELPDAFGAVAQFITVMPEMKEAFEAILRISTESASTKIAEASITLSAYASIIGNIISSCSNGSLIQPANAHELTSVDGSYSFTLKESSTNVQGTEGVLQISVGVSEEVKNVIGVPLVFIDGYRTEKNYKNGISSCHFINEIDGSFLPAAEGQRIHKRTLVIENLNILARQNVSVSVCKDRNTELAAGKTINSEFVYTTGSVELSDHYFPNFERNEPINIALIPTGEPVTVTLRTHLENLFRELLKENTQSTLSFKVVTTYSYEMNNLTSTVQLPVMMQSAVTFILKDPHCAPDEMVENWTTAINQWLNQSAPSANNAMFEFNLSVYSNLTGEPTPLIQLSSLYLELGNIIPGGRI